MKPTVFPVEIALRALGIAAVGSPAKEASVCCLTGKKIQIGDLVSPASFSGSFTDSRQVQADPSGKHFVCGEVVPFFSKQVLDKFQSVICSEQGAFPLGRTEWRAWFLLNPPPVPFVAQFSTTNCQHLIWKGAVTHDPNYWLVQHGRRLVSLSRPKLFEAVEAAGRLCSAVAEGKKISRSPFVSLDPSLGDLGTGVVRPDIVRRASLEPGLKKDLRLLESLSLGELWGIGPLLFSKEKAVKPEPIKLEM